MMMMMMVKHMLTEIYTKIYWLLKFYSLYKLAPTSMRSRIHYASRYISYADMLIRHGFPTCGPHAAREVILCSPRSQILSYIFCIIGY